MTYAGLPNPQSSDAHFQISKAEAEETARNAEQSRMLHDEDRPSGLRRFLAVFRHKSR